jgi:hypothetical protein
MTLLLEKLGPGLEFLIPSFTKHLHRSYLCQVQISTPRDQQEPALHRAQKRKFLRYQLLTPGVGCGMDPRENALYSKSEGGVILANWRNR